MTSRLIRLLVSLALIISASVIAPSTSSGHNVSACNTANPTSSGYLIAWPNANSGGTPQDACSSDNEWGNGSGSIQGFHDTMTSYHGQDRAGDGSKMCLVFFEDPFYGGGTHISNENNGYPNGDHHPDDHVGDWNDKIDSHKMFGNPGAGVCPTT